MSPSREKQARMRERRLDAGLTQISSWILASDKDVVRAALLPFEERAKARLRDVAQGSKVEPDGQIRMF